MTEVNITINTNDIKRFVYRKNTIMILYFSVLSLLPFDFIYGLYLESLGDVFNLRAVAILLILYFHSKSRRLGYLKMLNNPDKYNKAWMDYFKWMLHGLAFIIIVKFALQGGAVEPYFFIFYYILSWIRDSLFFKSKSTKTTIQDSSEYVSKRYLMNRNLLLLVVLSASAFLNQETNSYFDFIITYSLWMFLSLLLLYVIYTNDMLLGIPDRVERYFKQNRNVFYMIHIAIKILYIISIYIFAIKCTFEIPILIALSVLTAIKEYFVYPFIS